MKKINETISLLLMLLLLISINVNAQVGIGTTNPNTNAMLDIDVSGLATKKGFLPPRMTTAEKNILGSSLAVADKGMMVFDTDLTAFYYWNGTQWLLIRIDSVVTDSDSLGNIYYSTPVSTASPLTTAKKINGGTTAVKLINFDTDGGVNNRLRYIGSVTRNFTYICSLSFNGLNNSNLDVYSFYIAKGSPIVTTAILPETKVDRYVQNGSDVGAISISGTVELASGEWIEVWAKNNDAANGLDVNNFNILIQSIR